MNSHDPSRVTFVQDALPFEGGAERVLAAALGVYPTAPIHTLVFDRKKLAGTVFEGQTIYTSWIDRLPGPRSQYRRLLPLLPWTIERFDLRQYEVILSFSYAVAHGVVPRPDQLHISYTYAPLRYAWQETHAIIRSSSRIKSLAISLILHYLRMWDLTAASRVDHFVAISRWVADCIWRAYRRRAEVIYPPVNVNEFQPLTPRGDYYISVTRLEPHKKVGLLVDAFSRLGYPLYVLGDGPELKRLRRRASANIQMLGRQPQAAVAEMLGRAKAYVHVAEEDFGIAPLEAQAAGCPVIAFGRGGLRETVVEGVTGVFFREQTVEGVAGAVRDFEEGDLHFDIGALRQNAERFRLDRFQRQFADMVSREWDRFQKREKHGYDPAEGGSLAHGSLPSVDKGKRWPADDV